ncbi:MAG: magnesium transporter [Planctomycetes bacterium]|nr:magnesium transporter [Planctomycetota bacterium]
MVMAIGGMVGSQASTLIIRALATNSGGPFRAAFSKEMLVSVAMAAALGIVAFGNAWILGGSPHTSLVMGIAMAADVVFAAGLGVAVPNLVRALRIDPALISTPAVTALTDLTGATIFLLVITMLL